MKFLTFTDVHEDKEAIKLLVQRAQQKDIDFLVCCGDISTFGRGLRDFLETFDKVGKPFYAVPGNHEEMGTLFEDMMQKCRYGVSLHSKAIEIGEYVFLGYGTGGFSMVDEGFRKIARQWYGKYKDRKIILVTHGPPYGTKLDFLPGHSHVGNKDYSKFIHRIKPKLVISGHLHETVGAVQVIEGVKFINPGWEGMTVELK